MALSADGRIHFTFGGPVIVTDCSVFEGKVTVPEI